MADPLILGRWCHLPWVRRHGHVGARVWQRHPGPEETILESIRLCGKHSGCAFAVGGILVLLVSGFLPWARSFSIENDGAWQLLINNKPFEAKAAFEQNLSHAESSVAGGAWRGMAYTEKFLGHYDKATDMLFRAFLADHDTLLLLASAINIIPFGRTWGGHTCESGYRALRQLTRLPSRYLGEFRSLLAERYTNDGKLKKAGRLLDRMGVIRDFRMIGPFDNISGSGYRKLHPPEKNLDFTKDYIGKDGARIRWFPFHNANPGGWVFTEHNYAAGNAVLYYYANINSKTDQDAYLGFGASGSFKVFLNDNLVLADSVFRNTGTDMFVQKVHLRAGDNKLLIKMAHEARHSNFLVRFMGGDGAALPGVACSAKAGLFLPDAAPVGHLTNSPIIELVTHHLARRLARDTSDLEAAILLLDFYNATELTDRAQQLAEALLAAHPASSLLHVAHSEALQRSLKLTEAQAAVHTAFRESRLNYHAWYRELDLLSETADTREVLDFVEKSPVIFRTTTPALLATFSHHAATGNQSAALAAVEKLEEEHAYDDVVASLLVSLYASMGSVKKAEALLRTYTKWQRTSTEAFSLLANLYLKMGRRAAAVRTFRESLKYSPNSPGFHSFLAELAFRHKEYASAEESIGRALAIMPTASSLITLKGAILNAQGKSGEATDAFREAIGYRYDDFDAWDQLLPLEGKPELTTLTSLPDPDSLRASTATWEHANSENGAILAYIKDIYFYPSRCSRERHFIMVHLATRNAIDVWKEYSIGYNRYYQSLSVSRAFSVGADGRESPADVNRSMVVFKTLQPGDDILIEWTVKNHYRQQMAGQVWGEHEFDLPYPVFLTELRLVTPVEDTIPFTVQGAAIMTTSAESNGFRITRFGRAAYRNPLRESYALIDPPTSSRVHYSTFTTWAGIADWYSNLTENKQDLTTELRAVADSLLADAGSPRQKVARIHEYITRSVRYSFVPFRQSAWIPQPAREVLATKIGDCKDMASLGKSLLDHAGVPAGLVLVDTRDRNSVYPSYIGPNFNHCILSYEVNGRTRYVDMTDNSLSANHLPRMDQGALALVIRKGSDSLIHLPVDSANERGVVRTIRSTLDSAGTLTRCVESEKRGVFAGSIRATYRHLPSSERTKILQNVLVTSFPAATVDTLIFTNLDSPGDLVTYRYRYTAHNAARFTGNTALFAVNFADQILAGSFPSENMRHYSVDMAHTWFGIGSFRMQGTLTVPKGWRLISVPPPVRLHGSWGSYELVLHQRGREISYSRRALFNFTDPVEPEKYGQLRNLLSEIARADNLQLMFYTN